MICLLSLSISSYFLEVCINEIIEGAFIFVFFYLFLCFPLCFTISPFLPSLELKFLFYFVFLFSIPLYLFSLFGVSLRFAISVVALIIYSTYYCLASSNFILHRTVKGTLWNILPCPFSWSFCHLHTFVERGCLLWPVHSLGKTLLVFALLHSVLQGRICLLCQVSLDFLLLHSSPL